MSKLTYLILFLIVIFLSYGILKEATKPSVKDKRISCQEQTITFEKIANLKLIETSKNLLRSNNYYISSHIEYSKYMKSQLNKYINIEKSDELLNKTIKNYLNKAEKTNKKLEIKYYIYENDKEDKGKKGKKSKLYAGYLLFEFKLDNKLIYKIQTDYMKLNATDIPNRMDCVIRSFITLKGE